MKIYVFGNPLIEEDSLPITLVNDLQGSLGEVEFVLADPNENFPPKGERDLVILDTVKGIKKPEIFDLKDFEGKNQTPITPHDYDLLFHLLFLKKLERIDRVRIIGIPPISR